MMSDMTKAESIAQEIRKLNGLDSDTVNVPNYDRYTIIICKVDPKQLVLPAGYHCDGGVLTNKGNTGNNGYWSFQIRRN